MPSKRLPLMELSENDAPASNAAEKRRVSGRAVRAPEKFVPNAPSSQPSVKRKRGVDVDPEDVENEIEEDEDESDEDDDEESADEEEIRAKKRRTRAPKKHAAKKPKVNGTAPRAAAPAVKLPTRQKKPKKVVIQDVNAEGLYAEIFTTGQPSDAVAAKWLGRYDLDNTGSMTDLVNCILKSAGCELKVTDDDVNDPDNIPGKLDDMQEEYKEQNITDYPLISKAKSSHGFRVTLLDFFDSLITTMHTSEVLYDDIALIENIQLWVSTMSSSFLRPFRHTATAIALTITTSLCRVAKEQTEATANSLGILEGEKKKRGATKTPLTAFQKRVDQGNERKEICINTIKDFFDTVFVHRYRDVDSKIRTDCVEALGQWLVTLPGIFMEAAYLRYLGWMFSDTSAPTRHEAVKQLEKILKNTARTGGMREFIERFRQRILEMAGRDSDVGIRISAVDLLDLFREAGMLEPNDIDVVGKLIFDSEPRVRKSVVGFFVENIKDLYESKIEELGGEEALEDVFAEDDDDYEKPRQEWLKLKCLAEVLLSYDSDDSDDTSSETDPGADTETLKLFGVESRFSLAAQALYDRMPEVKYWKVLAGYLLFDHSVTVDPRSAGAEIQVGLRNAFTLEEKEEVILLEILDAAVKLNLGQPDDHEKAKDKSKKKTTTAGHKEIEESVARHLALIIPRLLSKFGSSPKTTAAVLRLEQLLNLGVFQSLRMERTGYVKLLHEIGAQFKGHSDQRVLNEASASLLHARSFEELEEITEENLQTLWEDTVDDLKKRFHASSKGAGTTARGDLSVEHLTGFATTVARVSKLASILNPVSWFEANPKGKKSSTRVFMTPIDILIELVNRGILSEADPEIDDLEDALVTSASRSALFYFMWKARTMQESISSSSEIADIDVDIIKERLYAFKRGLFNVFNSRGGVDDLRLLTTGTLLDSHVLFSTLNPAKKSLSKGGEAEVGADNSPYAYLETLVQEIEPGVQEELTSIFVTAEKQYAKKARKALEPPADDDEPEDIESDSEDDEDDEDSDSTRKQDTLKAEQKLCELTGKLVLGILAGVIDRSGPLKGKLRGRIQRNRNKLGPNFREVVAYLDDAKPKDKGGKKSQKSKAQQAAAAASEAKKKSADVVEEDDDEDEDDEEEVDDPFAEAELDDIVEEPGDDENAGNDKAAIARADEDDIMGD